jgi:hypothetical protein
MSFSVRAFVPITVPPKSANTTTIVVRAGAHNPFAYLFVPLRKSNGRFCPVVNDEPKCQLSANDFTGKLIDPAADARQRFLARSRVAGQRNAAPRCSMPPGRQGSGSGAGLSVVANIETVDEVKAKEMLPEVPGAVALFFNNTFQGQGVPEDRILKKP